MDVHPPKNMVHIIALTVGDEHSSRSQYVPILFAFHYLLMVSHSCLTFQSLLDDYIIKLSRVLIWRWKITYVQPTIPQVSIKS